MVQVVVEWSPKQYQKSSNRRFKFCTKLISKSEWFWQQLNITFSARLSYLLAVSTVECKLHKMFSLILVYCLCFMTPSIFFVNIISRLVDLLDIEPYFAKLFKRRKKTHPWKSVLVGIRHIYLIICFDKIIPVVSMLFSEKPIRTPELKFWFVGLRLKVVVRLK